MNVQRAQQIVQIGYPVWVAKLWAHTTTLAELTGRNFGVASNSDYDPDWQPSLD